MNIEVLIGCIVLATGIFIRIWSRNKQRDLQEWLQLSQDDGVSEFDSSLITDAWFYDRMSILGKAVTYMGATVIMLYHEIISVYPTTLLGVVITTIGSLSMLIFWIFSYSKQARYAKKVHGLHI
mgnify:CR=1 FL=1